MVSTNIFSQLSLLSNNKERIVTIHVQDLQGHANICRVDNEGRRSRLFVTIFFVRTRYQKPRIVLIRDLIWSFHATYPDNDPFSRIFTLIFDYFNANKKNINICLFIKTIHAQEFSSN